MAATVKQQFLKDSNKLAVVKLTGELGDINDDANTTNLIVVDASSMNFAMNANNQLMVSNVHPKAAYPLTIRSMWGAVNIKNGFLKLLWDDPDGNTEIVVVADSFDWSNKIPVSSAGANVTGDIRLSTVGANTNDSFTLFLELTKDATAFDQGQTADPAAFNVIGVTP